MYFIPVLVDPTTPVASSLLVLTAWPLLRRSASLVPFFVLVLYIRNSPVGISGRGHTNSCTLVRELLLPLPLIST